MLQYVKRLLNYLYGDILARLAYRIVLNLTVDHGDFADEQYVDSGYRIILGRPPDAEGLAFYLDKLKSGAVNRSEFVQSLVRSNEFEATHQITPLHEFFIDQVEVGNPLIFKDYVKDVPFKGRQLNELANPLKWIDGGWRKYADELAVPSTSFMGMHRKTFEWVQTIYGLDLLRKLNDANLALGVGTGHESILYWLARHLKRVYATDLFRNEWQTLAGKEGDPNVLVDPARYKPFEYPQERLVFLPMDGCHLGFPSDMFDVVFSLSSIEHFGSKERSAAAVCEMGRVLKPGGIAVIATEYVINGADHPEFFDDWNLLNFVVKPSGLKLIQDINLNVPKVLLEKPIRFPREIYKVPHLSLSHHGVIWTSIILFFEKRAR